MTFPHQRQSSPVGTPHGPIIKSITDDFTQEALMDLRLWLESNPPAIPVAQVTGFSQFLAVSAPYIAATETTTSTSFANLATVGPVLTSLPNGKYLFLFGAAAKSAAGDEADMGVQVNSDVIDGQSAVVTLTSSFTSVSGAVQKNLTAGSNTVTAKYLSLGGGTASFGRRFLIALKFANL